jgi:flavin-dependent dehydrogenase
MGSSMYDVAIIGGGPAGSTAAALLSRAGRRVIVFEREKFPRFHIGESLLPFSMKAFTRLELHEKFLRAGFMKKFGGEIIGACSHEDFLEEALAEQPITVKRMTNARRVSQVYVEADFSYRSARLHGDRWLLAGDAAGFIDPIFSSAVFLAVFSGELAADALNEVLDCPRKTKRLFARL